jgi:hypothetical protein
VLKRLTRALLIKVNAKVNGELSVVNGKKLWLFAAISSL